MTENTIKTLLISEKEMKDMILQYLIDYIDNDYATFNNVHINFNINKKVGTIETIITMTKDVSVDDI